MPSVGKILFYPQKPEKKKSLINIFNPYRLELVLF